MTARRIGERLRVARDHEGLDLPSLAHACSTTADALAAFEAGMGTLPVSVLLRAAALVRVPPGTFLHDTAPDVAPTSSATVLLRSTGLKGLAAADHLTVDAGLRAARAFAELGSILGSENLAAAFKPRAAPKTRPYVKGYEAAEALRKRLGNPSGPLVGLRALIEDRFDTLVLFRAFVDDRIHGLAARSSGARLIVLNRNIEKETTRRFVLAHELAHILYDLSEDAAILDEPDDRFTLDKSPREKRADAFAAMFLAPRTGVRALLGDPSATTTLTKARDFVERARLEFGLGFESMTWHLKNLDYYDEDMAALLLRSPGTAAVDGFEPEVSEGVERRVRAALSEDLISVGRAAELRSRAGPA